MCETLRSEIHRLVISIWNGGKLPQQWTESTIASTNKLTTIHNYQIHIT